MDARLGAVEVVVDLVGDERAERREQLARPSTRQVCSVANAAGSPSQKRRRERRTYQFERSSTNAGDRVAGARGVVGVEPLAHRLDRRVQARERPAVEVGRPARRRVALDAVDVRVQDVEAVRVPELEQELAHATRRPSRSRTVAVPRLLGGEEVPAERVGAVAVDDVPRRDDVAERLRHLLALGVGDVPEAEHGAVGRAVEQQRRDRQQRVEPAARLVDRLADVVGREARLELLLVLERRVALRERHRARVEPDVDHLGHAAHLLAALRARRRSCSSTYGRCGSSSSRPARASSSANEPIALDVAVLAAPDRQRRAPVALARDRPVDVVLQPLAEAPVLDVLRVPVDRLVGRQQPVAQRRRADVPGRLGVVEQRRAAAPAVRVGVQVGARRAAAARARAGPRSGRGRRP